jgi:nicotinamide phosphoribosyltransferase
MSEMMIDNPMLLCDVYKVAHRSQYPENTEKVYSTWTPRMSRIPNVNKVVAFGFQSFIKEYLIKYFNENFFNRDLAGIVADYKRILKSTLGVVDPDTSHIESLWNLGYLPLRIKAVKEGRRIPIRTPILTIENTIGEFFWLTNYLETLMSSYLWMPTTSATLSNQYRTILDYWANKTGGNAGFVPFQGHDFSMRGMSGLDAAKMSGAGHLLSFAGSDTIPATYFLEKYYNADAEKELVAGSVPASEHSVMCCNGMDELKTLKRFLTEIYPTGIVSVVLDTWSFFDALETAVKPLKDIILARDGKLTCRPDSGDPVKIVCGDPKAETEAERKGAIEILWDIFGGTVNEKGFKELDSHIGCIYGDAITIERCSAICELLAAKGFASTNMVFGIGSFTFQYTTRDTLGFALKSTFAVIDGKEVQIFKDPVTDKAAFKKSQKGMVCIPIGCDSYVDGLNEEGRKRIEIEGDQLEDVFIDGKLLRDQSLQEIRAILDSEREVWQEER